MIEVVKPGLETSVQDWPGRHGYWNKGFPVSGPMDSWSMRMANVLVGNAPGDAALEAQFLGPTLKFQADTVVAICGADMRPRLDGAPLPLWQSVAVRAGQILEMSAAISGARAYIAVSGGIENEIVLGSRATFAKAGVGGIAGKPLQ
jgi:urea carboxylase